MEKTIKLGKKSVRLDNSVGWTLAYRDQFGKDILASLVPALTTVLSIISGLISETGAGTGKEVSVRDLADVVTSDAFREAMIYFSTLEITEIMNITWAMAKNADEDIDDPDTWIRTLESFPVDEVVPVIFGLISKGFMSSKNLKRLQTMLETLKPSLSTASSSQDLSGD